MNKVLLFGNVGKDPEIKTFDSGKKIGKFSLATSKHSKDKDGNKVTTATWHNIVVWEKLAELCESWVRKGSSIIIEGEIQYRDYTDKDGVKKYFTEILCNSLYFAGGKKEDEKIKPSDANKLTVKSMSNVEDLPGYIAGPDVPDDSEIPF